MTDLEKRESSRNRSVERTLHLLSILEEARTPLTLTEISVSAKLQKSTVQRLLAVLEQYGYAEKRSGRYHLGPITLPLAYSYLMSSELSLASLPVLQELATATTETASLFVRVENFRVAVQRVEGIHPLRYVLPIGRRLPLHMGVGKVLAAGMPDRELSELVYNISEVKYADGRVISNQELLKELLKVRAQGYAVSRNEREMGVSSIAAPVFDASKEVVAAVSIAGATEQIDHKLDFIILEVRQAASSVAERLSRF